MPVQNKGEPAAMGRKRKTPQAKSSQPDKRSKQQKSVDAVDSMASGLPSPSSQTSIYSDIGADFSVDEFLEIEQLKSDVKSLNDVIHKQQETITLLGTQLDFLMSLLGVSDGTSHSNLMPNKSQPSNVTNDIEQAASWPALPNPACPLSNWQTQVTGGPKGSAIQAMKANFRTTVASVVYREQQVVRSKARNFIISGLPISQTMTDEERVSEICRRDLRVTPDIKKCQRLGLEMPGREQKLLVITANESQASSVMTRAKFLRQSSELLIRKQVFINADLTKAESKAAYESRQRRREAKQAGIWYPSSTISGRDADTVSFGFDFGTGVDNLPGHTNIFANSVPTPLHAGAPAFIPTPAPAASANVARDVSTHGVPRPTCPMPSTPSRIADHSAAAAAAVRLSPSVTGDGATTSGESRSASTVTQSQ
jgi:hypothetical protein